MRKALIAAGAALMMTVSAVQANNIVEVAQENGSFNTLLAAATAAGLAGALADGENLTVFAPTDEAFAALPEGTVETLLKPENKDQLVAVLSYHVVPQKLTSDMLSGDSIQVETLKDSGDKTITLSKTGTGVTVDEANVVAADIRAENGIIHVIDKVMLPSN